jgi:hypothetical protein
LNRANSAKTSVAAVYISGKVDNSTLHLKRAAEMCGVVTKSGRVALLLPPMIDIHDCSAITADFCQIQNAAKSQA